MPASSKPITDLQLNLGQVANSIEFHHKGKRVVISEGDRVGSRKDLLVSEISSNEIKVLNADDESLHDTYKPKEFVEFITGKPVSQASPKISQGTTASKSSANTSTGKQEDDRGWLEKVLKSVALWAGLLGLVLWYIAFNPSLYSLGPDWLRATYWVLAISIAVSTGFRIWKPVAILWAIIFVLMGWQGNYHSDEVPITFTSPRTLLSLSSIWEKQALQVRTAEGKDKIHSIPVERVSFEVRLTKEENSFLQPVLRQDGFALNAYILKYVPSPSEQVEVYNARPWLWTGRRSSWQEIIPDDLDWSNLPDSHPQLPAEIGNTGVYLRLSDLKDLKRQYMLTTPSS